MLDDAFLDASDVVDWKTDTIQQLASELKQQADGRRDLIRVCFEWVRDNIQHTLDYERPELCCRASDVLASGTGYCYAKSHLLAALLRAGGIPTGFCYQRLTVDGEQPPFCLHGLNAVHLEDWGWYRIDARGNKPGVDAQFVPPKEQLAFSTDLDGEVDFPEVWPMPLSAVVASLTTASSAEGFMARLPDATVAEMTALRESADVRPELIHWHGDVAESDGRAESNDPAESDAAVDA